MDVTRGGRRPRGEDQPGVEPEQRPVARGEDGIVGVGERRETIRDPVDVVARHHRSTHQNAGPELKTWTGVFAAEAIAWTGPVYPGRDTD